MVRFLALTAISGVALHAAAFAALHILEPTLSPLSTIISDYASTGSAWLATAAFLAFAVIWAALALALAPVSPGRPLVRAGRLLFVLAVVGMVVGALMPETADPRTGSAIARLQNLAARPGLFLGVLLVSLGVRKAPGWTDLGPVLIGLAVLGVLVLLGTVGWLLPLGLGGVGQRVAFLLLYGWALLTARRIGRGPRAERPATPGRSGASLGPA